MPRIRATPGQLDLRGKAVPVPEAAVLQAVIALLRLKGAWFCRHVGAFQKPGMPDITCIYKGRVAVLEIKKADWKPPRSGKAMESYLRQKAELEAASQAGAWTAFVTDVAQVQEWMQAVEA